MNPKLSTVKAQRTKLKNRLTDTLDVCDGIEHIDAENRSTVDHNLRVLAHRSDEIRTLNNNVLHHSDLPDQEVETELDQADAFYDRMVQCTERLKALLAAGSPASRQASPAIDETNSSAAPQRPCASHLPVVLTQPPILDTRPERFEGDRLKFRAWKASFDHWIGQRTTASDTDRFLALLKLLEGPPRKLLQNLAVSDASYGVALTLLTANYGHTKLELTQLRTNLLNLPPVKSSDDTRGLVEFVNHLEGAVLALDAAGVPLESYAVLLETALCNALPAKLLLALDVRAQGSSEPAAATAAAAPTPSAGDSESASPKQAAAYISALIAAIRSHIRTREIVMVGRAVHGAPEDGGGRWSFSRQQTKQNGGTHHGKQQQRRPAGPAGPPGRSYYSTAAGVAGRAKPRYPCLFCDSIDHASSRCCAELTFSQRCEVLDKKKRCHSCLLPRHNSTSECRGPRAPCRTCQSPSHYTAMHGNQLTSTQAAVVTSSAVTEPCPLRSLVMTANAHVIANQHRVPVRVFIDPGSNLSFVSPQLIDQLGGIRPAHYADLRLQAFVGASNVAAPCFNLCIESTATDDARISLQAYRFDFAVDPPNLVGKSTRELIRKFANSHQLADPSLLDDAPAPKPSLLLGMDAYRRIVFVNSEVEVAPELIATKSHLGWILGGALPQAPPRGEVALVHAVCCATTLAHPSHAIERLWTLESIGITDSAADVKADDVEAVRQFTANVRYDGGAYTVSMPKKASIGQLANNLGVARRRLTAKRIALSRRPAAYSRYHRELMAFVSGGHAVEMEGGDEPGAGARDCSYFMPHHEVITQADGKEKCRIVFDCSAAAAGETSLNAHLLAGPSLNPDLVQVLFNFRLHPHALATDITKAYLQLNLHADDQPYFCFLWQGPDDNAERRFRMTKVAWGATPSGFLLAASLRDLFRRIDPDDHLHLGDSFYCDDVLRSFATEEDAIEFVDRIVPGLASAGMSLAKWRTNSSAVGSHLAAVGVTDAAACRTEGTVLKVLGLSWAPAADDFQFQLAHLIESAAARRRVTKRSILRIVASLYDPLGWLLPYSLRGKLIIQQLWSKSLRWDETVDEPTAAAFHKWVQELSSLEQLRIPRLYGSADRSAVAYHLHVFGDASESAYAAAVYLQTFYTEPRRARL